MPLPPECPHFPSLSFHSLWLTSHVLISSQFCLPGSRYFLRHSISLCALFQGQTVSATTSGLDPEPLRIKGGRRVIKLEASGLSLYPSFFYWAAEEKDIQANSLLPRYLLKVQYNLLSHFIMPCISQRWSKCCISFNHSGFQSFPNISPSVLIPFSAKGQYIDLIEERKASNCVTNSLSRLFK